ncbi:MAG: Crp/Fnr family transcriptional regulator [Muribaculaceae bacterium]|nr:Crp/Fnr family transcriptional regulator [Muribaculaceae bacterium]
MKKYEHIMQLPLFSGASEEKIAELVEKIPFHFLKYEAGDHIFEQGENCTHLRFIVNGAVRVITKFQNLKVSFEQTLVAPHVLGAQSLFGIDTAHPHTALAATSCGILQLKKADFISVLQSDKVFLFNILNYLSLNYQRGVASLMGIQSNTPDERLMLIVKSLSHQHASDVQITFTQKDLSALLCITRAGLAKTLHRLQEEGRISLVSPSKIVIN